MPKTDTLDRLRHRAVRAREIYQSAARKLLLEQVAGFLAENPDVIALGVEGEYCYDDEGGYFLSLNGQATLRDSADDPEAGMDAWQEFIDGCDLEQEVLGKLFGLSDNFVGEALRRRDDLLAEAATAPTAITEAP